MLCMDGFFELDHDGGGLRQRRVDDVTGGKITFFGYLGWVFLFYFSAAIFLLLLLTVVIIS